MFILIYFTQQAIVKNQSKQHSEHKTMTSYNNHTLKNNNAQSSFLSPSALKTEDYGIHSNMKMNNMKIDHAYILENYKQLRLQQRQKLSELRMPEQMKKKLFGFQSGENLKSKESQLFIFNHPFKGRMVMTKQAITKQLQKQKQNAQKAQERMKANLKVEEPLLNEMAKEDSKIQIGPVNIFKNFKQSRQQKSYQMKRQINEQGQDEIDKRLNPNFQPQQMYFIHKKTNNIGIKQKQDLKDEQVKKQKIRKKQLDSNIPGNSILQDHKNNRNSHVTERQNLNIQKFSSSNKNFISQNTQDFPIVGEQPHIVKDLGVAKQSIDFKKSYYRPFGNESEVKQFQNRAGFVDSFKNTKSEQNFLKKKGKQITENLMNPSISGISMIKAKDGDQQSLSQTSLNKALFIN